MARFYKKYRRLSGMEVCNEIEKFFKNYSDDENYHLSDEQMYALRYIWGNNSGGYGDLQMPFQAYSWKKENFTPSPLVRLTTPFFFIVSLILVLIVRPIHWLITGKWWFHHDHWVETLGGKWEALLFGE